MRRRIWKIVEFLFYLHGYCLNESNLLIFIAMTEEEIVKQVKAIIVDKLGVEESEVTETANFTNDLGADSLDTVELLMEFERVFGIKIPDEETSTIATVKDAIDKVQEKLAGKEE